MNLRRCEDVSTGLDVSFLEVSESGIRRPATGGLVARPLRAARRWSP